MHVLSPHVSPSPETSQPAMFPCFKTAQGIRTRTASAKGRFVSPSCHTTMPHLSMHNARSATAPRAREVDATPPQQCFACCMVLYGHTRQRINAPRPNGL